MSEWVLAFVGAWSSLLILWEHVSLQEPKRKGHKNGSLGSRQSRVCKQRLRVDINSMEQVQKIDRHL